MEGRSRAKLAFTIRDHMAWLGIPEGIRNQKCETVRVFILAELRAEETFGRHKRIRMLAKTLLMRGRMVCRAHSV